MGRRCAPFAGRDEVANVAFVTEERAIRVVTDGISIGDVIAAKAAHYETPGPWYGIPLATITTDVDADGVMRLLEETLTGH